MLIRLPSACSMSSEAAERRALLFCVGSRPDENAALWTWAAASRFFDPTRDALTFVFCRTETEKLMVRSRAHVQSHAACGVASLRLLMLRR